MLRLLFALFFGFQTLALFGQDDEDAASGEYLPYASSVYDHATPELAPLEVISFEVAPAPPVADVSAPKEMHPEAIPPSTPVPPPIPENGDAKDMGETRIYTPLPVETEAFSPQDPFLYHEGPAPFESLPLEHLEIPAHTENPGNQYIQPWTPSVSRGHCAPVIRRCVADNTEKLTSMYVAGLYLHRSASRSQELFQNPLDPRERFNAADFDFDLDSGIEAGFTAHRIVNELDFDIRYFAVNDAVSSARDRFTGPTTRINSQTPVDIVGPRDIFAAYETSLRNVEANLRFRYGGGWNWLTFIAGFRYLNLQESMSARFVDPGGLLRSETMRVSAENDMYGFQVGMDKTFLGDRRFSLDGYWRAGLYGNSSASRVTATSSTFPGGLSTASGAGNQTAFVGELGLKGRYAITRSLNAFGSYQLLLIDDVALATNQLATANATLQSGHHNRGKARYQGVSIGLEYSY